MQLERVELMMTKDHVTDAFQARFGEAPTVIVRAPGRVDIIGGHTDYSGGYVLPLNVNRNLMIALRAREDTQVNVYSEAMDETTTFDLDDMERQPGHWGEYLKAAAWILSKEGHALRGWDGVICSDIPIGIGLGSSAALLMSTMGAFAALAGIDDGPLAMAKLAHKAQTEWIHPHSGFSDLLSVAGGKAGEALLVDEQNQTVETVQLSGHGAVLVLPTNVHPDRSKIFSLIEERLAETTTTAKAYKVSHLRDLSMSRFEKDADEIDDTIFIRARHILTENGRTILAAEMLRSGAIATVGRLMSDSHASLQDNYGVTSEDANVMVACALEQPNVLGARAGGYGQGSLVVALVQDISADTALKLAQGCYKKKSGHKIDGFVVEPINGVEIL